MPVTSTLFAARYAFLGKPNVSGPASRWFAREADGGRRVTLAVVDAARATQLEAARGVSHRHLASTVEVLRSVEARDMPSGITLPASACVGVAELIAGKTLAQHISSQPMNPGKAVAWILRLIDALTALHAKGAVHGAVSPWSIVAEPEGRAIAPVLAALIAPPVGAYCPPEQLKGEPPAPSDDVWALHAVLYAAVTGKSPFDANQRDALLKQMLMGKPKSLAEHGLTEPALGEIISRGLMGEKRLRVVELAELSRALDAWERDPKAMPVRRPAAPRAVARSVQDIVSSAAKAARDETIVFDAVRLPQDNGLSALAPAPSATAERPQPPPLPAVAAGPPPLPQVNAAAGPPPLPAVAAGPPPLPVASSLAAKSPPPLPAVAAAPPVIQGTPAVPPVASGLLPPEPSSGSDTRQADPARPTLGSSPFASLGDLAQQLPQAPAVPVVVPVAAPGQRPARRLSFNPFERKRKVWPIVVGAALTGGLGVYAIIAATSSESPAPVPTAAALKEVAKPRAPEKAQVSPETKRDSCVASYFPDRAVASGTSFGFACEDGDFREISQKLFSVARQQPLAASTAGKPETAAASLGWYELPAAAIIRKGCCVGAAPVNLPETVGWCEQLESAVRRLADDSEKAGDLSPGARAFDKAVTCLYVHRISRPYTYDRMPGEPQRRAFQTFLSLAAINEARR